MGRRRRFRVLRAGIAPSGQLASVANRLYEPDCAPHPGDIMALYALYQRR